MISVPLLRPIEYSAASQRILSDLLSITWMVCSPGQNTIQTDLLRSHSETRTSRDLGGVSSPVCKRHYDLSLHEHHDDILEYGAGGIGFNVAY